MLGLKEAKRGDHVQRSTEDTMEVGELHPRARKDVSRYKSSLSLVDPSMLSMSSIMYCALSLSNRGKGPRIWCMRVCNHRTRRAQSDEHRENWMLRSSLTHLPRYASFSGCVSVQVTSLHMRVFNRGNSRTTCRRFSGLWKWTLLRTRDWMGQENLGCTRGRKW